MTIDQLCWTLFWLYLAWLAVLTVRDIAKIRNMRRQIAEIDREIERLRRGKGGAA